MAEPGDPNAPDDHDDLIGFASTAALQGRARTPEPTTPEPEAAAPQDEPEPDLFAASAGASVPIEPDPAPAPAGPTPQPQSETPPVAAPAPAASIFEPSPEFTARQRRREPVAIPGGGMGLYAVYALILFAVPTLGVSAVIGLLAVTGRPGPEDPLSQSHFVYQQRTLWAAAVAVAVGLIFFLVPFGFGPAIMFIAALWVVARGAAGVWALKAGRPIADPRGWWF
ncbi:MAG: hypothetical protein IR159_09005 [Brevundimonas sp.]|nr:hypothetical protein [Brevundimonas sp.]